MEALTDGEKADVLANLTEDGNVGLVAHSGLPLSLEDIVTSVIPKAKKFGMTTEALAKELGMRPSTLRLLERLSKEPWPPEWL